MHKHQPRCPGHEPQRSPGFVTEGQVRQMRKSSRKLAKVFHEKDATLMAETV